MLGKMNVLYNFERCTLQSYGNTVSVFYTVDKDENNCSLRYQK